MSDDIRFDHYFDFADVTRALHALAARRPDLITVESIGKSHEGRDIWCATVTNRATGPASEKPALWIDGNIHATELSAASAAIYFLNRLVGEYGANADITRSLDTRAFYVVPRMNPDGAELYFADKPRFVRSSVRPYPYDEEGLEGFVREDVDGDGRILNMRVVDPNGPWKCHPDEPRLLVRRDPTEVGGTYYRVLPEGTIENWDGITLRMKARKEGLDLNRNFPGHWRQEHEQPGAGPYPTSEPEVRTVVDFICSHPNIVCAVTFHTYGGLLLRPYGTQADETFPAEDLWVYQAIGKKGTEITGYPNISVFHDFRYHPKEVITGVFDDWIYDHLGVYGWTVEIWCPQREAGIKEHKPIDWYREHPIEDDLAMLKWSDETLGGKGYVEWQPFEHPQLGSVEIGGWDSTYAFRNAPPEFLEREVAKFPDWLIFQSLISPKLELERFEVTALGEGVYRLRLVVDNSGWLPSYVSKKAVERKVVRGVIAELELPEGAELVTGKLREELGELEGRAGTGPSTAGWTSDMTDHRAKMDWTIRAKAGSVVKVVAKHDRAGLVRAEATLA